MDDAGMMRGGHWMGMDALPAPETRLDPGPPEWRLLFDGDGNPYNSSRSPDGLLNFFPIKANRSRIERPLTIPLPALASDPWIEEHTVSRDVKEIEDCAIAVDASYYIQLFLDTQPYNEPLLPALGGLTGIQQHIEVDLDQWAAHGVIPFFIFDGQPITGEDEVSIARGLKANEKTNKAWDLYFESRANDAVTAFGKNNGAYRVQSLYPMLQSILKERKLHFKVTPYNAAAQIAYFDLIDSDQVSGIMGSQELLMYPIHDGVIRSINWEDGKLSMSFKKDMIKALNVNESMFIDALLMIGTTFLPQFPPLLDASLYPRPQKTSIADAINVLRTADKSVGTACASFNDILQVQDPNWLDKYRKARMWVNHFIYISEDGQVLVHDYDKLTQDNHEYLGLQLPPELFHYLDTGLIGPRVLSWITHCKISVLPTLAGVSSDEYRNLVTEKLVPIKEMTLGLLVPRLNRGIQHRDVVMKVWWDDKFSHSFANKSTTSNNRASGWGLGEETVKARFPQKASGSIAYEISALRDDKFVKETHNKERIKDGLEPADAIVSLALWRFLHLKGYASDAHDLTPWGIALAAALDAFAPTVKKHPEIKGLNEAVLLALELIRYGVLTSKNRHEELQGIALQGTDAEKDSLMLISRCAALLKLRHKATGYTGPLSKNLLFFHSLISEVRDADRDLLEAVLASMFMNGQAKRERDDGWDIRQRLPFLNVPDVALGVAVKTLLDEVDVKETKELRAARMEQFPAKFFPYATHFGEDISIAFAFCDAVYAGVQALGEKEISKADKAMWKAANEYLTARR